MSLCMRLSFQPPATNSLASQLSRSGWVGFSPMKPKLFELRTMPRPKWCCQRRLAMTRAVIGLLPLATHSASTRRFPDAFPTA